MLVKAKPLQALVNSCRRLQLSEFLDVEAGEFNGVTVVLQADGTFRWDAWKQRIFDDPVSVEGHAQAISLESDNEAVPFADGVVGSQAGSDGLADFR